ncbi:aromatic acid decarboxylase [Candidatus Micrarchaeota archaeon]|nr:MAG: aromatic acid decarboxylase [Candidatus Micrarchaeota archaeon]
MRVILGITGASGAPVALRLSEQLRKNVELSIIVSEASKRVMKHELGHIIDFDYNASEIDADIASSSNAPDALVVCPCSSKTLSSIANNYSDNLIGRVADIVLRTKGKLILCPRETPYSLPYVENLRKVLLSGAYVLPLNVAYYTKPKSIEDITDFFVGKVLDILGIENNLYKRWKSEA